MGNRGVGYPGNLMPHNITITDSFFLILIMSKCPGEYFPLQLLCVGVLSRVIYHEITIYTLLPCCVLTTVFA